jgi:hypothetical protein
MVVKNFHQIFYYHSTYLNSMKCREINIGPSIHIMQCKVEAPIRRSDPFPHSIKPAKLDSAVSQK